MILIQVVQLVFCACLMTLCLLALFWSFCLLCFTRITQFTDENQGDTTVSCLQTFITGLQADDCLMLNLFCDLRCT